MFTIHKCANIFASLVVAALLAVAIAGTAPIRAEAISAQATTWYVAPSGKDTNACNAPAVPCMTIRAVLNKAAQFGDTVKVGTGTYTHTTENPGFEVASILSDITISGGWNSAFTAQTGMSIIDGQGTYRGITIVYSVTVSIDHFVVQNGYATDGAPGGINSAADGLTLDHTVVTASSPGGVWSGGGLIVRDSSISENTGGPGIMGGALVVENSVVDHNTGGGITVYQGGPLISNSTISNNGGYALRIVDSGAVLKNSTITGTIGNEADPGTGILYRGIESYNTLSLFNTTVANNWIGLQVDSGAAMLANSIVAANSSDGGATASDCIGSLSSGGYNIVGSASSCSFAATTGDQVGTADARIDAKLAPLAHNAGPTLTHALLEGSPALNAGNPTAEPGSGGNACLATDQRGFARPALAAGACDIGAYERMTPAVTSIQRSDANPTSGVSVHFAVAFNDVVTGPDAGDFALTTTGDITGASVTAVENYGSTHLVTVSTGSGYGTMRLDLTDDDSILDAYSGEPLGGTGMGNGSFTGGEVYTISGPRVVSVSRADVSPTAAANVAFIVTFSAPVTGVNIAAPFSDFRVVAAGITGAAVTAVTPVVATDGAYRVTVKRGTGSGTLRLDVIDDGSIADSASGRQLGGPGNANGNYTAGQAYIIAPMPQAPSATVWDTTPTFKWTRLAGVTQYRFQVLRGTTVVNSAIVPATACGTVATICSTTPTKQLLPANYSWRVQAYSAGLWRPYSALKAFALKAPKAGAWASGSSWVAFNVLPNRVQVSKFLEGVTACGTDWVISYSGPVNINAGKFAFTGKVFANGTFTGTTLEPRNASGRAGFNSLAFPCGTFSANLAWATAWYSSTPLDSGIISLQQSPVLIPVPGAPFGTFQVIPANP